MGIFSLCLHLSLCGCLIVSGIWPAMGSSKVRQTLDSMPPASPPTSGGNPYLVGTATSNDGCHPLYPDTAIYERQARVGWTCGGLMYGYGGTFAAQPNATNLTTQGQRVEIGPNSEVQLYRVVWGTASGIAPAQRAMPGTGGDCQELLCLIREDYLNMHVHGGINGSMFGFGGGAYVPPGTSDPASETFFIYGSEHYIQRNPRLVLWNEF